MTCATIDHVSIMDTYSIETDGLIGFQVQVINAEGETYMTSPSLRMWSDAHAWIDQHRQSAGRSSAGSKYPPHQQ